MTKFRFIATNIGALWDIGSVFDMGTPGSGRITEALIRGDIDGVIASAKESMEYISSQEGMQSLIQKMLKWGLIELVKDAVPFKKSWTFGKFTFGI